MENLEKILSEIQDREVAAIKVRTLELICGVWIQRHIDAVWDEAHRVNSIVRELDGEFNK